MVNRIYSKGEKTTVDSTRINPLSIQHTYVYVHGGESESIVARAISEKTVIIQLTIL